MDLATIAPPAGPDAHPTPAAVTALAVLLRLTLDPSRRQLGAQDLAGTAVRCGTWDAAARAALTYAGDTFEALALGSAPPPGVAIDAILCLRAGIAEDGDARCAALLQRLARPDGVNRATVDDWVVDALGSAWDDLGRNAPRHGEYLPGSFPEALAKPLACALFDYAFATTRRRPTRLFDAHAASPNWHQVATLADYVRGWEASRVRLLFQVLIVDPQDTAEGGALDLWLQRTGWRLDRTAAGWVAEHRPDGRVLGHPWASRAATVLHIARDYAPALVGLRGDGWTIRRVGDDWVADHPVYGSTDLIPADLAGCWRIAQSRQEASRSPRARARR